jgi:hypothetical protein
MLPPNAFFLKKAKHGYSERDTRDLTIVTHKRIGRLDHTVVLKKLAPTMS